MRLTFVVRQCLLVLVCTLTLSAEIRADESGVTPLSESDYITFISPSPMDNWFWGKTAQFAGQVAEDLGIRLEVLAGNNERFTMLDLGQKALQREHPPRALIVGYFFTITEKLLDLSRQKKIPIFLVNTRVSARDQKWLGEPRSERYPNWLGHMYPDDVAAGYVVAQELLQRARQVWPNKKKYELLAVNGALDSMAARDREDGLNQFLSEHSEQLELKHLLHTNWLWDGVVERVPTMLERYPSLQLVWSASDLMAMATRSVAKNAPLLYAGIDWSDAGLQAVREHQLEISLGGHFTEVGWITILLFDYFNGVDFAPLLGLTIKSPMSLASSDNVDRVMQKVSPDYWTTVDFSRYSRSLHPEQDRYHFFEYFLSD
ncbi:ABC transporter substrate-binding protein [Hahella ganghwensis]|uniref:ABC transporter substrate-binding protein n=1 Tax=Hahella ganghwensis TaxID=286420 RepID=UPI00035E7A6C|nr:ABC transporter substrate-binding protein [Hahella ganghwensis]